MFAGGTSAGGALLSPVAGGDLLSTMPGRSSSFIAGGDLLFAVSGHLLSFIAGNSLLFAISGRLWSTIASGIPLSTFSSCLLSPVTGGGPLSTISGYLSSFVIGGGPLSVVFGGNLLSLMLLAGSQALFLTSTPSHTRCFSLLSLTLFHFSLPFLPTPLIRNPTLFTGKQLFD